MSQVSLHPMLNIAIKAARAAGAIINRASLDIEERTLFDVGDNPLGQALAKLARSIKQRESARQTESQSGSLIDRKK